MSCNSDKIIKNTQTSLPSFFFHKQQQHQPKKVLSSAHLQFITIRNRIILPKLRMHRITELNSNRRRFFIFYFLAEKWKRNDWKRELSVDIKLTPAPKRMIYGPKCCSHNCAFIIWITPPLLLFSFFCSARVGEYQQLNCHCNKIKFPLHVPPRTAETIPISIHFISFLCCHSIIMPTTTIHYIWWSHALSSRKSKEE